MSNEKRVKDYTHKCILFSSRPESRSCGTDNQKNAIEGPQHYQYDALVVMADCVGKEIDLEKIEYRSMTVDKDRPTQANFSDYKLGCFLVDEGNWKLRYKSDTVVSYERNEADANTLSSLLLQDAVVSIVSA